MAQKFRIFGDELGRTDAFVDCKVVGANTSGLVRLESVDDGETWSVESSRLSEMDDNNLVYDCDSIDTSRIIWDALNDLETRRSNDSTTEDKHYRDSMRELFHGAK